MNKILLPIDIVHPAQPVIEQLEVLVPLADKEIHLLYVNEAWPSYEAVIGASGDFADDLKNKLEEKARAEFDKLEQLLKGKCAKVSSELVVGPPAMMIETVARDELMEMTVLSPGRHSAVQKFFLGTVSSAVVKHAQGTILISRPKGSGETFKTVLIGLDGSNNSREALRRAVDLFDLKRPGLKVVLFHAVDVADPIKFISPVEFISAIEQNLLMEGETILAEGKSILDSEGITRVDTVLKEGKPEHELLELASSLPADLIVIGAEGRTAVQHFLLGSVSQRVAMHAPCAVAVAKRLYSPS